MKNRFLRVGALFLCLSLLLCLAACHEKEDEPLVLTREGAESYLCAETGVTYLRAPSSYLPRLLKRTPYATYTAPSGYVQSFFEAGPKSASSYLFMADTKDYYPYYMIVAEGYRLPSLAEMKPNLVLICSPEEEFFWSDSNVYDRVRLTSRVDAIVSAWTNGAETELPSGNPQVRTELVFADRLTEGESSEGRYTEYAWFCSYYSFGAGETYLHDSATGRTVKVSDTLLEGYALTFDAPTNPNENG